MTALAAGAVLVGAGLQSATGFGFALVAAPILFAVLDPQPAVSVAAVLGMELSLLTLLTERRVPHVLRGEAVRLVAWSLPGLAVGALALRELPDRALEILVALAVLVGLALRLRVRRRAAAGGRAASLGAGGGAGGGGGAAVGGDPGPSPPWRTAAAGACAGALSTSTALSGPPLVLHLLAGGASPAQMRDTLAAVFGALAVLTVAALLLAGVFVLPAALAALLGAGLAGHLLGRRGFARLHGDRYEDAVLVILAVTAVVALGAGLR